MSRCSASDSCMSDHSSHSCLITVHKLLLMVSHCFPQVKEIFKASPFLFVEEGVSIMDGTDEGRSYYCYCLQNSGCFVCAPCPVISSFICWQSPGIFELVAEKDTCLKVQHQLCTALHAQKHLDRGTPFHINGTCRVYKYFCHQTFIWVHE